MALVARDLPQADPLIRMQRDLKRALQKNPKDIKWGMVIDIAKCIALGASLGGMAGQFLKAAAVSTESAVEMMKLTKRQIEVTMFAAGVGTLEELRQDKLVVV